MIEKDDSEYVRLLEKDYLSEDDVELFVSKNYERTSGYQMNLKSINNVSIENGQTLAVWSFEVEKQATYKHSSDPSCTEPMLKALLLKHKYLG